MSVIRVHDSVVRKHVYSSIAVGINSSISGGVGDGGDGGSDGDG